MHEPPGGPYSGVRFHRRSPSRRREDQYQRGPARGGDGLSAVQPISPYDGARQSHSRPKKGERKASEGSRRDRDGPARASWHTRAGGQEAVPIVGRATAASGDRPFIGDEPQGDAFR